MIKRTLTVALALLAFGPAQAVTVQVTNGNDSGPGSLRDAINLVNAGSDTENQIVFTGAFPQGGFVELLSTLPAINRPTVEVLGFNRPVLEAINPSDSFTYITAGPLLQSLRLQGMQLRSGRASIPGASGGGCISSGTLQSAPMLILEDMRFESCVAAKAGFARGGAVLWERGPLIVRRSVFEGGGAVSLDSTNQSQASGGAIYAGSTLTLERSDFFNGTAVGRGAFGGAISALGNMFISDSRFVGNTAMDDGNPNGGSQGGAIIVDCFATCSSSVERSYFGVNGDANLGFGGAMYARGNGNALNLTLRNVTFDFNRSEVGGALELFNVALSAEHLTFSSNIGNPAHLRLLTGPAANISNSVFTSSASAGCSIQLNASGGGNITSDATCTSRLPGANQIAGLAPLATANYPTMSVVRFPTSSAVIDSAAITQCAAVDARGAARPQDGNGDGIARCDVGAFEHPANQVFRGGFEAGS